MKLGKEWRQVMKKAWSFRLAILTAILSAAEVGVQILAAEKPSPYFAGAAAITGLLAAIARILSQAGMSNGQAKDD